METVNIKPIVDNKLLEKWKPVIDTFNENGCICSQSPQKEILAKMLENQSKLDPSKKENFGNFNEYFKGLSGNIIP